MMPTMMRDAAISFPLLGNWSIDPSASFTLFGRTFYSYGVIIAVGVLLATLYILRASFWRCSTARGTAAAAASSRTRSMTFSSG